MFLEAELHLEMLLSVFQFENSGHLDSQSGQSGTETYGTITVLRPMDLIGP